MLSLYQYREGVDFIKLHILHDASEDEIYGLRMIEELAEGGYKINASQSFLKFHRLEHQELLRLRNRGVKKK